MELKLAWLYPDLLEIYGDSGNVTILKSRCQEAGIDLVVDQYSVGDNFNINDYDMVFLGGGSDRELSVFYQDLLQRKDQFQDAIDNEVVMLLVCSGYQLFGTYYQDISGNKLQGLGIFDYYTETAKERTVGYLVTEAEIDGKKIYLAGFENHSGLTYQVKTPLAKVLSGTGNNGKDKTEGVHYKNLIGTYMFGPLLARNLELTDLLIQRMAKRKGLGIDLPKHNSEFEKKAKQQIIKENNLKHIKIE